jgi:hypothetical protein
MNSELAQGSIDGTYKQVSRDRGGFIEPSTYDARRDLFDLYFGFHEAPVKRLPDNTHRSTPTYQPTPPVTDYI